MRPEGPIHALEALEQGIAALARGDAAALRKLNEEAEWMLLPENKPGWQRLRERHAGLARLLVLTRRNLRLLRLSVPDRTGEGGPFGGASGRHSAGNQQ